MLISLTLQNFMQHTDLTLNFSTGLNVIRGNNEAGKSTVITAITYALFGARALPMSLEETVTWGVPAARLKVVLEFVLDGTSYKVTRSKSGAALVGTREGAEPVTSDGHAPVTAFIEKLFNASAVISQATLVTKQKGLTASLGSGSVALIEELADIKTLERLIERVGATYPTGSTKALELQLASIKDLEVPVNNTDVYLQSRQIAEEAVRVAQLEHDGVTHGLSLLEMAALEAGKAETLANSLRATHDSLREKLSVAATERNKLSKLELPNIAGLQAQLFQLKLDQQNQKAVAAACKRYAAYTQACNLPLPDGIEEAPAGTAERQQNEAQKLVNESASWGNALQQRLAVLDATLIVDSTCPLCELDLTQVPAVTDKNARIRQQIADVQAEIADLRFIHAELLARLKAAKSYTAAVSNHSATVSSFGFPCDNTVEPCKLKPWEDSIPVASEIQDFAQAITETEAAIKAAQVLESDKQQAELRYENLSTSLAECEKQLAAVLPKLNERAVEDYNKARTAHGEKYATLVAASKQFDAANVQYLTAQQGYEHALKTYTTAVEQRDGLIKLIGQQQFFNELIRKLRDARPVVSRKLWQIVLAGVTVAFSRMRGVQSVVDRATDGFTIDGKPAEAFSGSTQDILGLAIRITLLKTFLPTVGFMLIDEPGAAADDERETEMVGILSSCGLDQVVMVTHSPLADSFATNVIRI